MGQGFIDALLGLRAPAHPRFLHQELFDACARPDVLCVQELMSGDAERFFDGLGARGFAARFRDHNKLHLRTFTGRGSGLGVGSRHPILRTELRTFAAGAVGWDRLARKGALYAEIMVENTYPLDVLTVHMQAGVGPAAVAVRAAQLEDIADMIDELGSSSRPFVVCGDFNIDGLAPSRDGDEYRAMRAALRGFEDLGAFDDLPTYEPHPQANTLAHSSDPFGVPQRIDYLFFRAGGGVTFKSVDRFLDRPLSGNVFASDHYALCASLEISPRR
jgi:endonuclease/exonuclease/phosphatase family metal-dependent hydrolase